MVRRCMAGSLPFGVCLITRGNEVGRPAEHESVGCTARIVDFDLEQPGVLQLRTVGEQRFRILSTRLQPDGLIMAKVDLIDHDPTIDIPDTVSACGAIMKALIDDLARREPQANRRMIAEPYQLNSAGWVANRLCEFLPLDMRSRQALMALEDPLQRLAMVHQFLVDHQAI
jgi:Lon protease-like protein